METLTTDSLGVKDVYVLAEGPHPHMLIDQEQAGLQHNNMVRCGHTSRLLGRARTHQSHTAAILGLGDLYVTLKTLGLDIVHLQSPISLQAHTTMLTLHSPTHNNYTKHHSNFLNQPDNLCTVCFKLVVHVLGNRGVLATKPLWQLN